MATKKEKAQVVIHGASVAAGTAGAGLAQIPGSDNLVITQFNCYDYRPCADSQSKDQWKPSQQPYSQKSPPMCRTNRFSVVVGFRLWQRHQCDDCGRHY